MVLSLLIQYLWFAVYAVHWSRCRSLRGFFVALGVALLGHVAILAAYYTLVVPNEEAVAKEQLTELEKALRELTPPPSAPATPQTPSASIVPATSGAALSGGAFPGASTGTIATGAGGGALPLSLGTPTSTGTIATGIDNAFVPISLATFAASLSGGAPPTSGGTGGAVPAT